MNLKRLASVLAAGLAFAAFLALLPANAQSASTRKPRVAVLDFDYATVQSASSAMFGTDVDVGKGICRPAHQ